MIRFIITLCLLLIVAYCTWRGYRNGIVRGVCGIVAILLALYGAGVAANMFSEEFKGVLMPFVSGMIDGAADKVKNNDESAVIQLSKAEKADAYMFSYACARQVGLVDRAAKLVAEETAKENNVVGQQLYEELSDNLVGRLAHVAVFCIAFAIIAIVFGVIGNVINVSLLIPKLGVAEPVIGAVLGLIKGVLLMYAVAMFLRYLGLVLPKDLLNESGLLFKLINDNPVASRVGL